MAKHARGLDDDVVVDFPRAVPGPTPTPKDDSRWEAHPVVSRIVKFIAIFSPIVSGVIGAIVLSELLPDPTNWTSLIMYWLLLVAGSALPFLLITRLARRLLPLTVLLDLTMLFPDEAPSRLEIARKAGRTRDLKKKLDELKKMDPDGDATIAAAGVLELIANLGTHDRRTRGHSERVRVLTDMVADELNLPPDDRDRLRWAALLHDLGKLTVAAEVLNKPDRPDASEWAILRRHPVEGARIAEPLWTWLGPWMGAIQHHHEKFDGTGYPYGLAGKQISLGGRIVAVTDSYEVMTAARAYKKPMSVHAARTELVKSSGSHFDPAIVRTFLNVSSRKLFMAAGVVALIAQIPIVSGLWSKGITARLGRTGGGLAATAATIAVLSVAGVVDATPHSSPDTSTIAAPSTQSEDTITEPADEGSKTGKENGKQDATGSGDDDPITADDPDGGTTPPDGPPQEEPPPPSEPPREDPPPPREPSERHFSARGEIGGANPLESRLGGVTQHNFEQRCGVPATQGVDGWVFRVPAGLSGSASAAITGTNSLGGHSLNAYLYSSSCTRVGSLSSAAADERGRLPDTTAFIVVNETSRPGTTVALSIEWIA
jgi:HD domain